MKTLGPANDNDPNVQIEIRAARLDDCRFGHAEALGWTAHLNDRGQHVDCQEWHAGWLAREIETHNDRDTRDADAWPWDPSRPVAGQYEEWRAHMDLGDATPEEAIASAELANPDIISAISQLGADVTPPELTVEQLANDLCDGCDEPKTECRRIYAGCLTRPDSDSVHGPCCELNCPDMATHFSRTGSIP